MTNLVVLKIGEGSFEQGFAVTLQIGLEGELPSTEIAGKLPPLPEIPLYYSYWQSSYQKLETGFRLFAPSVQVTNVSMTQDCQNTANILQVRLNTWLRSEEFRPIREKWLERLSITDEIRVILQTENNVLQRLPWHLWEVLQRYPKAEFAIASPSYERIERVRAANPKVNILAILGNSQGIDTQADQILLQELPNADVTFLVEPNRSELTNNLWGKNWDILFFAGHSSNQNNNGRIFINKTDSLTIDELKYALSRAVERGLALAIFNSCDGLGVARQLADLQIPQVIVMREPVPDLVAQEFLKYFLSSFALGESFYLAVRHARERLQGLEDKFPCATWLPVICQNLSQIPPTWKQLSNDISENIIINNPLSTPINQPPQTVPLQPSQLIKKQLTKGLLSTVVITAVVSGLRFLGLLQGAELHAFDQMMRSRLEESSDPRLLIVKIDDADIVEQRRNGETLIGTSISDKSLNKLLEKLESYQPRAIGLDIYRDFPAEDKNLAARLRNTQNLIVVCKGGDSDSKIPDGIKKPPEVDRNGRLGFSDFIHDSDGVVRRHLLFMNPEAASLCPATYALSTQLAFRYLLPLGITPKLTPKGDLQLGNTVFNKLESQAGGYQDIDANGGQILLNWRATKNIAEQVTLTQLLAGQVNPKAVKDKIVLIGVTSRGDLPDYWATPFSTTFNEQMPGVVVHAHKLSEILSAVLDKRPLLNVWSPSIEGIWIWSCSVVGVLLVWFVTFTKKTLVVLILGTSVCVVVFYAIGLGFLIKGYWIPFVPSALALIATVVVLKSKNLKERTELTPSVYGGK
jgi:CHASE2 domain-containing sensor protein